MSPPQHPSTRRWLIFWLVLGVVFLCWQVFSYVAAPELIRSADGGDVPFVSDFLESRGPRSLDHFLERWEVRARRGTAALLALGLMGGIVMALSRSRRIVGDSEADAVAAREHPATERLGSGKLLLAGLWIGLVGSLLEAFYLGVQAFYLGEPVPDFFWLATESLWMVPVAVTLLCVTTAVLMAIASRAWPFLARLRPAAFLLILPALIGPVMAPGYLHLWAALLLTAGLAYRASALISRRPAVFWRLVRRTTAPMVAVLITLAIGIHVLPRIAEGRAAAALPPAEPGSPNVLLIVLDTERAKNLSLYGYHRATTPRLRELAREGVTFERAFSNSPWTLPSHGTLFTGRAVHELKLGWTRPLDERFPTLAEELADRGYRTGGFVANFYFCTDFYGLDRGFLHYEDQPVSMEMLLASSWLIRNLETRLRELLEKHPYVVRKGADEVSRAFLDWLDEADGRPYFAFLNYFEAHAPYLPPAPFDTRFSPEPPLHWLKHGPRSKSYTKEEISQLIDAYDSGIAYLDHEIALLFDELEQRGALDNTLVIITSDHGEEFGEHGNMEHDHTLYAESVHVPLVILPPRQAGAGRRVTASVGLNALPATVMDIVDGDRPSPFPGASLARFWAAGSQAPDTVLAQRDSMDSLIAGRFHYIRSDSRGEELYDYVSDPLERRDISGTEEGERAVALLRAALERRLNEVGS